MTKKEAYRILDLDIKRSYTEVEIRKQYKILALQYHPDKNGDPGAIDRFREIADAMHYLCDHGITTDRKEESYRDIMRMFITEILAEDTMTSIIQHMIFLCEEKAIGFLRNINKDLLIQMRKVIELHRPIFHLSDTFIESLDKVLEERTEKDERIIFHPTLADLFGDMLYKYTALTGEVFVVPLWHHSLVYDNSGADLYIECYPILPENMWIDEYNHLHVEVLYELLDVWTKEFIEVDIGGRIFYVPMARLYMIPNQVYHIKGCGISAIDTINIYNVDRRMDIILYLTIR